MRYSSAVRLVVAVATSVALVAVAACGTSQSPAEGPSAGGSAPAQAFGVEYDATHVYVEHGKLDAFIASWEGTFGGTHNQPAAFDITPTASKTLASIIHSPVGLLAAYDYQTPVPYPFGTEPTGFAVKDVDGSAQLARSLGGSVAVAPWTGPTGRETVVRFPGGFSSQLWRQTDMSGFTPVTTQPEFRVYLSEDSVHPFLDSYLRFTGGRVVSDTASADGGEVGAPGTTYHRIRLSTPFGNMVVLANPGYWNYPFGKDSTGYSVSDVNDTVAKATAHGATVLAAPYTSNDRTDAVLQFPGGYVAEVHDGTFR